MMTINDYQYNVGSGTAIPPMYTPIWQQHILNEPPYLKNRMYEAILDSVKRIAMEHDATASFSVSTNPEDLEIVVCVGLQRDEEVFQLDFGRIVSMLEKQGTFDLDWSEVENYIAVTCAMLPQRKIPTADEAMAQWTSLGGISGQQVLGQMGNAFGGNAIGQQSAQNYQPYQSTLPANFLPMTMTTNMESPSIFSRLVNLIK